MTLKLHNSIPKDPYTKQLWYSLLLYFVKFCKLLWNFRKRGMLLVECVAEWVDSTSVFEYCKVMLNTSLLQISVYRQTSQADEGWTCRLSSQTFFSSQQAPHRIGTGFVSCGLLYLCLNTFPVVQKAREAFHDIHDDCELLSFLVSRIKGPVNLKNC